jgi:hypothetical protein
MVTYQVEKFEDIYLDIQQIFDDHWEEVALDKESIKLNPDYDKYILLSKTGILHMVTAREYGKIIGYHISVIYPHIHYKDSLTCFTDIFFVVKEKRKGFTGIKLLKFMEESVKAKGVQKIYMGTKLHIDISLLLERLNYKQIEKIFTKVI